MYVCLCHGVTERHIRNAAAEGVPSFEALQEKTGLSSCCGACRDHAEATWQQALRKDYGRWCGARERASRLASSASRRS